jgi:hypothetical protein
MAGKLSFGFFSPPKRQGQWEDCFAEKRDESRDWPFYNKGGYADQAHFDNAFETRASSATPLGSLSHFNDKELDGEILRGAGFRTADLRILRWDERKCGDMNEDSISDFREWKLHSHILGKSDEVWEKILVKY